MPAKLDQVQAACEQFGIDWNKAEDWHLLPAVRQYLELPMPTFWKSTVGHFGGATREHTLGRTDSDQSIAESRELTRFYLDTRTSLVHTQHPLAGQFKALVKHLRACQPSSDRTGSSISFLPLQEVDGTRYFVDMNSQQRYDTCPNEAALEAVPTEVLVQFGLLNDTKQRVRHLEELTFKSWWYEDVESMDLTFRTDGSQIGGGVKKRYITLRYKLRDQAFEIVTHDECHDIVLPDVVSVMTYNGCPVQVWDLHVGARLSVMGKSLELCQASLDTSLWIDQQAQRLRRLRNQVLAELKKYKPVAQPASLTHDYGSTLPGGCCLRLLVAQIETIGAELTKWRPARAEMYLQQAETFLDAAKTVD